jgi:hypothetical protein
MHRLTCLACTLSLASVARADGIAYWLHDVTTDDGDSIVEPGETADVTLFALMVPNPGDAQHAAFGVAIFDILGADGAAMGHIVAWEIHDHFADLHGDLTTTDGVSLYAINAGQLPLFGPFSHDNPAAIISFQWQPDVYAPFNAVYQTSSSGQYNEHTIGVWEDAYDPGEEFAEYPVLESVITITVIPAPPGALLIYASTLSLHRPRRRGPSP